MKHYDLTIKANARPETMERILRVIRHRGFEVISLNVEKQATLLHFRLKVQSDRELSLLTNQLIKLVDIVDIQ